MKNRLVLFMTILAAMLIGAFSVMAAEKVTFEPVRAPSMGPEGAPVTIIEIADYM